MNEELKNKANEFVIEMLQEAVKAKDFLKGEIPEVINQLLTYHFWTSVIPFIIGVALLIMTLVFMCTKYKIVKEWVTEDEEAILAIIFISGLMLLPSVLVIVCNLDWFQIAVAPKLYIIEYIRGIK